MNGAAFSLDTTADRGHAAGWHVFERDGEWHWTAHADGTYGGGTARTEVEAQTAARTAYDRLLGRWGP